MNDRENFVFYPVGCRDRRSENHGEEESTQAHLILLWNVFDAE